MKSTCACENASYTKLFPIPSGIIARCNKCNLVRTVHTRKIKTKGAYTEDEFSIYLEKESMFRELFEILVEKIQKFKKSGRMLEVGSSVGLLLDVARGREFHVQGVELSESAAAIAKKQFRIPTIAKELKKAQLKPKSFDVVIYNHVLEHVKNPKEELKEAERILKSNGLLVIGVPNFGSFMAQLKGSRWQSLIPDQHRWHFTIQTLNQLLAQFGFKPIYIDTENHDRSMHYWWKRPFYFLLDHIALLTNRGEAMLAFYEKK